MTLKILQVHNRYRSEVPSGENRVVDAEAALLRDAGHVVDLFGRDSDQLMHSRLGAVSAALGAVWNPSAAAELSALIAQLRPDAIHIHNTFPLLSPSVLWAARRSRTPVVMTLHNYRAFCARSTVYRDGSICTLCLDQRSVWPGIRHACYRNSRIATVPVSLTIATHRLLGSYQRCVDRLVVMTEFQKRRFVDAGLSADAITVKPHFIVAPAQVLPWSRREDRILFLGRLSQEKGCDLLLNAWLDWGARAPVLEFAGDGEMRSALEARVRAAGRSDRVLFSGSLMHEAAMARLASAKALVFPSRWFETFGLVIGEAFARGVPVFGADIGGVPELIQPGINGQRFAPGDVESLRRCLQTNWNDENLRRLGEGGQRFHAAHLSPEKGLQAMESLYRQVRCTEMPA